MMGLLHRGGGGLACVDPHGPPSGYGSEFVFYRSGRLASHDTGYLSLLGVPTSDVDQYWQTPLYTTPGLKKFVLGKAQTDAGPMIKIRLEMTHIVADNNRDGAVDVSDVVDAKSMSVRYDSTLGAVILANVDRDAAKETYDVTEGDDAHRKVDWEDLIVNEAADLADIGKLRLGKLGLELNDIPDDMVVKLEIVNPDGDDTGLEPGDKVHLFGGHDIQAPMLLGGDRMSVTLKKNPGQEEADIALIAGPGAFLLGIEGWEPGAEVVLKLTITIGTTVVLRDDQHVLTAPFMFLSNLDPVVRLAASQGSAGDPDFIEFKAAIDTCGAPQIDWIPAVSAQGQVLHFVQDALQAGFSSDNRGVPANSRRMSMVAAFPNGWGLFKSYANDTLPGPGVGFFDLFLAGETHNMGGNVMLMPPDENRKFGTVVYGAGIDPELERFIDRQKVSPKCGVDLSGINLGHIDEFLCVTPGAVLVADFRAARNLLRIQENQAVQVEHGVTPISNMVNTYLPDGDLYPELVARLQAMEGAVDAAFDAVSPHLPTGMAVIRIPVFLKNEVAFPPPNSINCLVVNDRILMPDPCWKPAREAILAVIPGVIFVNTTYFSRRGGEIHCATNAIRERR